MEFFIIEQIFVLPPSNNFGSTPVLSRKDQKINKNPNNYIIESYVKEL